MDWNKYGTKCKNIWVGIVIQLLIVMGMLAMPVKGQHSQHHNKEELSLVSTFAGVKVNQNIATSTVLNKIISLKVKKAGLMEALNAITKLANLEIAYNEPVIEHLNKKRVTLDLGQVTVHDALWKVLEGTGLRYAVSSGKNLVLIKRQKETPALPPPYQETVTGQVSDAATGETLPGVNIAVKGTTTGTSTNSNGRYELTVSSLSDTLLFSFIGYQTQEIPINGRTEINVVLQPQAIAGDELVVVGYGEQSRRDITSSIASVNADEIANQPSQQIAQSLQGRIPGVQITPQSGAPGAPLMIRVRGIGSVNNSDPLYVVDGNALANPEDINPSAIEKIEVLKSASATAIYGAKGANGVVLITTKQGRIGNTQLNFNIYEGIQQARRAPMVNATQYAKLYNLALTNAGAEPFYDNPNSFGEGTDWQSEIFRVAPIRDIQLSVAGGSEGSKFYVDGSYFQQKGVQIDTDYERINLRINSSHDINPVIRLGQNFSASYSEYKNKSIFDGGGGGGGLMSILQAQPTISPRQEDGSLSKMHADAANPLGVALRNNNRTKRPILNGDVFLQLNILKNLTFRTQYNFIYGSNKFSDFEPEYFIATSDRNLTSSVTRSDYTFNNWNWENTLTYQNTFGNHSFLGLVGLTVEENFNEEFSASGEELPGNSDRVEALRYLSLANRGFNADGIASSYGMQSYLGRINYDYNKTYLATVNFRVDGSSKFGGDNKYGFFPSFSLGWRLSNENFVGNVEFINDLLIRGGWGQLGNQSSLSNYPFASTISRNLDYTFGESPQWQPGKAPLGSGNPNLKWETVSEANVGVDFTAFQNRINITLDYYNKKTTDMLLQVPVVAYSGVQSSPFLNAGEVLNKGYEFSVGYQRTTLGDFYYDISVNMSYNQNEIRALAGEGSSIIGGNVSFLGQTTRSEVGHPIAAFYGYVMDGLFQNQQEIDEHATQSNAVPGDIKFKDLNRDGEITGDDQTIIGNPWPSHTFGLNASFSWKNIDMNLGLQGNYGNDIFAYWKYKLIAGNWFNYHEDALNYWDGEGTSNTIPRLNINDPNSNTRVSSWYIEDGSYLRLKSVEVGYSIPQSKVNIRRLRVYANVTNLFTLTNYSGIDPEVGSRDPLTVGIDMAHYAVPQIFTVGLNVGL